MAQKYGLVNVSPRDLLKIEQQTNPAVKVKVQQALEAGENIPDEILLRLIDQRLK